MSHRLENRDLYRELLELGSARDIDTVLEHTLRLSIRACGAHQGYLEVRDDTGEGITCHSQSIACSPREMEDIRLQCSSGAAALAMEGETVNTIAVEDPRLRNRPSVQQYRIESVLVVPIGKKPPMGFVYLQKPQEEGGFDVGDVTLMEEIAGFVVPFVERSLLVAHAKKWVDPTAAVRKRITFDKVIGQSGAIAQTLAQIAPFVFRNVTILITGPTGSGKTHLAESIHNHSERHAGPFRTISCREIPDTLFESSFFGIEKGRATGVEGHDGLIHAANGGTLFLDEVGELSPENQVKLLTFLESGEFRKVGSTRTEKANVRIIAATHRPVEPELQASSLRADFFYRIGRVHVRIPSLAERREDIPLIAVHFLRLWREKHQLSEMTITRQALEALSRHHWPGNVRELGAVLERAVLRADWNDSAVVDVSHLDRLSNQQPEPTVLPSIEFGSGKSLEEIRNQAERAALLEALRKYPGKTEAATALEISRAHLYNLIQKHQLL